MEWAIVKREERLHEKEKREKEERDRDFDIIMNDDGKTARIVHFNKNKNKDVLILGTDDFGNWHARRTICEGNDYLYQMILDDDTICTSILQIIQRLNKLTKEDKDAETT